MAPTAGGAVAGRRPGFASISTLPVGGVRRSTVAAWPVTVSWAGGRAATIALHIRRSLDRARRCSCAVPWVYVLQGCGFYRSSRGRHRQLHGDVGHRMATGVNYLDGDGETVLWLPFLGCLNRG